MKSVTRRQAWPHRKELSNKQSNGTSDPGKNSLMESGPAQQSGDTRWTKANPGAAYGLEGCGHLPLSVRINTDLSLNFE